MGVDFDKIFLEWSYRSEKGYPDMDNPSDLLILKQILKENNLKLPLFEKEEQPVLAGVTPEEIKELIDSIKDDPEALKHIKNYIQGRPLQTSFFDNTNKSNITNKTLDTANAPQVLFDILNSNNELQIFNNYIKDPKTFSSLGLEGNLFSAFSETGLSNSTLDTILNLKGGESGRGVGKGELFLAFLVGDVKMSTSKGDLDWGGKYLEVKGTSFRLGGRGRSFSNFGSTRLAKLADEKGIDVEGIKRIDQIIMALVNRGAKENEILNAVVDFFNTTHPEGNAKAYFQNINLSDEKQIRKAISKIYIKNYAEKEGVDQFIFITTPTTKMSGKRIGNYLSFSPDQAPSLVDSNKINFGTFKIDDLDPTGNIS